MTTLSKEQIEEYMEDVRNPPRRPVIVDKEFELALCNMALQYLGMKERYKILPDADFEKLSKALEKIPPGNLERVLNLVPGPRPYDPKDEGTWPEKSVRRKSDDR